MARTKGVQEPGVDTTRYGVPGGVRRVDCNPVLYTLHGYPLLPGLGGQPLEWSEEWRMIGDDEISGDLDGFLQNGFSQIIGQEGNLHNDGNKYLIHDMISPTNLPLIFHCSNAMQQMPSTKYHQLSTTQQDGSFLDRLLALTIFSVEGSMRRPTLSQDSAKEVGARTCRFDTTFFNSMLANNDEVCKLELLSNIALTTDLQTMFLEIP